MVVLGHTISGSSINFEHSFVFQVIWTLQMPLFILISGYVTKYSRPIINFSELTIFFKKRTLAYMLEHFAGALPLWIAPEQVKIIPIADRHLDFANEIRNALANVGIRCSIDDRAEKMGKKIREATLDKIPYMLTVGDNEVADRTVSVRSRKGDNLGNMTPEELLTKLLTEIATKAKS
ncbi:MAG: hypothetical protein K2J71_01740 [Oscillospiraceae bacterium]|nr:hypothetical protein [Oscillospiraceae bacterium]